MTFAENANHRHVGANDLKGVILVTAWNSTTYFGKLICENVKKFQRRLHVEKMNVFY